MKRYLFLFWVAARVMAGPADTVERVQPSVFPIRTEKPVAWGMKQSIGTGVVVDERGYLVTANHVVNLAESVRVVLPKGTETAEVVARAPEADLALIRVNGKRVWKALAPSVSPAPRAGELVMALGCPRGFLNSVTRGIVSAVGRGIDLDSLRLEGLIQTDASINAGNSGGPLVTDEGRWIGLVIAVHDNAQGIGFALPADRIAAFLARNLPQR